MTVLKPLYNDSGRSFPDNFLSIPSRSSVQVTGPRMPVLMPGMASVTVLVVPLCWVMLSHFFKRAETKSRCILCYTLIYIYIYICVIILSYIYDSLWYHTVYIILIITNIYIYISMCVMVIIVIIVISMIVCIWPFGRVT